MEEGTTASGIWDDDPDVMELDEMDADLGEPTVEPRALQFAQRGVLDAYALARQFYHGGATAPSIIADASSTTVGLDRQERQNLNMSDDGIGVVKYVRYLLAPQRGDHLDHCVPPEKTVSAGDVTIRETGIYCKPAFVSKAYDLPDAMAQLVGYQKVECHLPLVSWMAEIIDFLHILSDRHASPLYATGPQASLLSRYAQLLVFLHRETHYYKLVNCHPAIWQLFQLDLIESDPSVPVHNIVSASDYRQPVTHGTIAAHHRESSEHGFSRYAIHTRFSVEARTKFLHFLALELPRLRDQWSAASIDGLEWDFKRCYPSPWTILCPAPHLLPASVVEILRDAYLNSNVVSETWVDMLTDNMAGYGNPETVYEDSQQFKAYLTHLQQELCQNFGSAAPRDLTSFMAFDFVTLMGEWRLVNPIRTGSHPPSVDA